MIRIIDSANALEFSDTLDQYFANRHTVFVKELGWTNFEAQPGVEKDAYDDEHAVHAIAIGDDGRAIGGVRFYPTTRPHMLSETFAHLVDGPIITGPDIYELTRFHLLDPYRKSASYIELIVAFQEVALKLGARGLTSIMRTLRLPILLETGIAVRPLGEPEIIGGVSNLAVYYDISEQILARMNKRRGMTRSVLESASQIRHTA